MLKNPDDPDLLLLRLRKMLAHAELSMEMRTSWPPRFRFTGIHLIASCDGDLADRRIARDLASLGLDILALREAIEQHK